MTNLFKKIDKILQEKSAYYVSDEFIVGELKTAPIIIVSASLVLEKKTFFKINKKKDLKLAVDLFVQKSSPFKSYHSWIDFFKASDGYFVVAYYVAENLYQNLKAHQAKGGIILPEQALVRKSPELECTINNHGSYIADPNYKMQFNLPKANLLQKLVEHKEVTQELSSFVAKVFKSLNVSKILPYWKSIHLGDKAEFNFTLGHLVSVFVLPLFYLFLTSAWLYSEHDKALKKYEENKEKISDYKALERNFEKMQNELSLLKKPFENYLYPYKIFDVMNQIDVFVSVQSFSINSTEISINGISDDASLVFKKLSEDKRLIDLRYVRPVRKSGKRESFTIGFKLENS